LPANKFALLRYRIIDRCIRSKGRPYPSKEDLRTACEEALYGSDGERISMSTIDKDLWAMRNEGELGYYAPIKFDKAEGGYFYTESDFSIAEIPLNEDDLQAINMAAQTLFQFRDIPIFEQFGSAIEKIMDRMKISRSEDGEALDQIIQFESAPDYQGSEFLEPVFRAISERRTVRFDYQKFQSDQQKSYHLKPYILKEYRNRWYMIGRGAEDGRLLTFGLERIRDLQPTEERYHGLEGFDAEQFFKHAIGITVTNDKPMEVELEFDKQFAPYILTQPIHASQQVIEKSEDFVRVRLHVQLTIELVTTILAYADRVVVLKPRDLKEEVKAVLTKCLNLYGQDL